MKRSILILFLLITASEISAQEVLDKYIQQGLKNNTQLKQASLEFESSLETLNDTRGGLLPKLTFSSRYTKANGGRDFVFPVGDLMNPVYNSLNGILGEDRFPEIENQVLNFNRTTDIDTKLTLTQPLFDKRISYQRDIAEEQAKISQVDVTITKRQLVANIKKAYFNYLKTEKLIEILDSTKSVVIENLRVSESLYNNDKVTLDVTLRARTEISRVDLQIAEAEKMKNNARAYFNFLVNEPLENAIEVSEIGETPELPLSVPNSVNTREEFSKIDLGLKANEAESKLYASNTLPNVYAIADYGFQGTEYTFNNESDYALASLVLSWDLFSGFQNKAKKQRAQIKNQMLMTQKEELKNNIALEAIQAYYDLKEKEKSFESTERMKSEAESTYEIINRKYKEGMASQLELIDARNNLTNATLQNTISKFDTWISYSEYERVTAAYPLENI